MTSDVAAVDGESQAVVDAARGWFESNWDPDLSLGDWWVLLAESGWGFPTWPTHRYGRGIDPRLAPMVSLARRAVGALGPPAGIGPNLAGPTLLAHGSEDQQDRFLPGIVHGEIWCQLFSEPGSGSDLASLQTRAVRDGDQWVVNGQKVWTSGAHIARYGILVARTNPDVPKHQGLTYFVIDMDQPGIEIRPIREMTGRSIFNEVFLADAVVPEASRLDEVGSGWGVALTTLANERTMLGAGSFGSSGGGMSITKPDLSGRVGDMVRDTASGEGAPSGGVGSLLQALVRRYDRADDPLIRQEYATIYSLLERSPGSPICGSKERSNVVERTGGLGRQVGRQPSPAHLARDDVPSLWRRRDAVGPGRPLGGRMHDIGFSSYLISIGGGTDQIQRNIIGERYSGLEGTQRRQGVAFSELLVGTQRTNDE
ncbi:MAG: acyl-CoA dehydrogenase family protein [Ilumatobacteraceae bacterium]